MEDPTNKIELEAPMVLAYVGRSTYKIQEAVAQAVENGRDAVVRVSAIDPDFEPRIAVVITPTDFQVIDNGHSMVPWTIPADMDFVAALKSEDSHIQEAAKADLERSLFSWPTVFSAQRVMRSVAYSVKTGMGGNQDGSFGIGYWSFLSPGTEAMSILSPHPDLLRSYHRKGGRDSDVRTWRLIPPSEAQLTKKIDPQDRGTDRDNRLQYVLEPAQEQVMFPYSSSDGKTLLWEPLPHGTSIRIKLRPGVLHDHLRPKVLVDFLRRRFAKGVGAKQFSLTIYYLGTDGEKETKGFLEFPILAPPPIGNVFYTRQLTMRTSTGGLLPFQMFAFSAQGSNKTELIVTRNGSPGIPLSQIHPAFKKSPWAEIGGEVEYPQTGIDHWYADKQTPVPSDDLNDWIKQLLKNDDDIAAALELEKSQENDAQEARYNQDLGLALTAALREIPTLSELSGEEMPKPSASLSSPTSARRRIYKPLVRVRVKNQHDEPVPGVKVALLQGDRLKLMRTTGSSGEVNFGEQPNNTYTIMVSSKQVTFPPGEEGRRDFRITATTPHFFKTIHVITKGEARGQVGGTVRVMYTQLDDPNDIFSYKRFGESGGTIELNRAHPYVLEATSAAKKGDTSQLDYMVAQYVAEAMVNVQLHDAPIEVKTQSRAQLTIAVFRHLNRIHEKRVREDRKRS